MANIRIKDLPTEATPASTDLIPLDQSTTRKATLATVFDTIRPFADQTEAEAGTNTTDAMNPLRTAQAIAALGATQFASAAQGTTADTALQPADIGSSVQGYDDLLNSVSGLTIASQDLIVGSGSNTVAKLGKGTDGQVLSVASGSVAWADPNFAPADNSVTNAKLTAVHSLALSHTVADRTALKALDTARYNVAFVQGLSGGLFVWDSSDLSTEVAADTQEGIYVSSGDGSSGAWVRYVDKRYDPRWFGAVGDNSTVNTDAIQGVVDYVAGIGGGEIEFLDGTYITENISVASQNNITFIGSKGAKVKISTDQTNGVFYVNGSDNIAFLGLEIEGTGSTTDPANGYSHHGIRVNNCDGLTVIGCKIHSMRGGGLFMTLVDNVTVERNEFYGNHFLADIEYGYAATDTLHQNCRIVGNKCTSSNAYGIAAQGIGRNLVIEGNNVSGKAGYGIMVYRYDDGGGGTWRDVVVANNLVEDVSFDGGGVYNGMGIYLQHGFDYTVTGNVVRDVLKARTDTTTPNRTLPPGAISINSVVRFSCVGNTVETSGMDGIAVVSTYEDNVGSTVSGNTITDVYWSGIYAQANQNLSITGNSIEGQATNKGSGIDVLDNSTKRTKNIVVANNNISGGFSYGIVGAPSTGTAVEGINVSGNIISDIAGRFIDLSTCNDVVCNDNILRSTAAAQTAGLYALILNSCNDVTVGGNLIKGHSSTEFSRGLAVVSCTRGTVTGNMIDGCSDVFYALYLASNTSVFFANNLSDRQTGAITGPHNVGTNPSSDTNIKVEYGTSAPASGSYDRGSIVWNTSPSASGTVGWVCVTAGSPGTWKTFGSIAA